VTPLTPKPRGAAYAASMEWMLQVADEVDDALGVLRHGWLCVSAELGSTLMAGGGIAAALAGCTLGAEPVSLGAAAITANLAALLEIRSARRAASV
jgi:hypothetical protein